MVPITNIKIQDKLNIKCIPELFLYKYICTAAYEMHTHTYT